MSKHVYRCMCGCKIERETIRLPVKAWQLSGFYLQLKAKLQPYIYISFTLIPQTVQDCKFSVNFSLQLASFHSNWLLQCTPCKPAKYTLSKLQRITKQAKEPRHVSESIVDSQKENESEQAEWGDRQNNWVVRAARKQHLPYKLIQKLKAYSKQAHKWLARVKLSIIFRHTQTHTT